MKKSFKVFLLMMVMVSLVLTILPAVAFAEQKAMEDDIAFKFSHLVNVDGLDRLIFTHLDDNDNFIEVSLVAQENGERTSVFLAAGNTSAEFEDIEVGEVYTYSINVGTKLHAALHSCTRMNENVVQEPAVYGKIDMHGTRSAIFAATSASIKLVFALLLNHKLSQPNGIQDV